MSITRKVIRIDEEKCDGCGLCVTACAEGALEVIDGKARLVSETYCDGLGACLGDCPQDAIILEERKAEAFDEAAVAMRLNFLEQRGQPEQTPHAGQAGQGAATSHHGHEPVPGPFGAATLHAAGHASGGGCPGAAMRSFEQPAPFEVNDSISSSEASPPAQSALGHWPIQIMLVPPHAPFLRGADLLVCADCVPFTVPDFHSRYLSGRAVLVGCPKLDDLNYYHDKLRQIFATARPTRVTVLRMEVPCCGGIAQASIEAAALETPDIPVEVHTVGIRGSIQVEKVDSQAKAV